MRTSAVLMQVMYSSFNGGLCYGYKKFVKPNKSSSVLTTVHTKIVPDVNIIYYLSIMFSQIIRSDGPRAIFGWHEMILTYKKPAKLKAK